MRKLLLGLVSAAFLTACMGGSSGPQLDLPADMAGQWLSNGYGNLLKVSQKGDIEVWQYTPDICLPESEDSENFTDYIDNFELADDKNSFRARISIEQHEYHFTRMAEWPSHCADKATRSPVANFEAFASFMKHHYVMFDLYRVDWDAEVMAARAKVSEEMSEKALFDLMTYMMRDLKDAHLGLYAEIDGKEQNFNPDGGNAYEQLNAMAEKAGDSAREYKQDFRGDVWHENIKTDLLQGEGKIIANNRIQYGMIDNDIGFLSFITMGGFSETGDPIADISLLKEAMTNAVNLFNEKDVKAVIIDNSINHGGYDFISRQIASHFTDRKVRVYSKEPGDAAKLYKTDIYLEPADGPRFTGPVYLLVSDMSVSAGEIFQMSLDPLSNVTVVGEYSRGALSDILAKTLPNGWELGMSNEIYLDHNGEFWEDRGIEPDWALPVFSKGKLAEGHMIALEKIVDKIRAK